MYTFTHFLLLPLSTPLLSLCQNHIFIKVSQPWLSTHSNNVIRTKVREKVGDSMLSSKLSCNHRACVKLMCKPLMNASCQRKVAVDGSQWSLEGVGQPAVSVSASLKELSVTFDGLLKCRIWHWQISICVNKLNFILVSLSVENYF